MSKQAAAFYKAPYKAGKDYKHILKMEEALHFGPYSDQILNLINGPHIDKIRSAYLLVALVLSVLVLLCTFAPRKRAPRPQKFTPDFYILSGVALLWLCRSLFFMPVC